MGKRHMSIHKKKSINILKIWFKTLGNVIMIKGTIIKGKKINKFCVLGKHR